MSGKIVVKGYQVGTKVEQVGLRTQYRAVQLRTGKEVLITIVSVRAERSRRALLKRAEQSKKLVLTGIISAIDYGFLSEDKIYYVHAIVSTVPVEQILEKVNDDSERYYTLVRFAVQALELLEYIHEAGITHRDITVSQLSVDAHMNVILDGFINARPKIEPRNIANVVNLPYMAPEQLTGFSADRRTDIYSMGVVLFELIAGKLPYESNFAKIEDTRQGIVPSPTEYRLDIPPVLEKIVLKMLAPRISRYRHVREIIIDLENFLDGRSIKQRVKDFSAKLKNLLHLNGAVRF